MSLLPSLSDNPSVPSSDADRVVATSDDRSFPTRTAMAVAGGVAAALAYRTWQRSRLVAPETLPPAVPGQPRTFSSEGRLLSYYERPGIGTPIVLLHSFNAAASSFELRPVFEHFAETTQRPLYALDWLGFGRSDRPDVEYRPALYDRLLYRFLTDRLDAPADLVALSLGGEAAARVTLTAAPRVRRLALIAPTGLTQIPRGPSPMGQAMLSVANTLGAFELLFYRLTSRRSLRDFYERQVFLDPDAIPDVLVEYASTTSHARGAHYAPLQFVRGRLFQSDVAGTVYSRLYRPTLLLTPENPGPTVQNFDLLTDVLASNPRDLHHVALPGGLLPHWETPAPCMDALDAFLNDA